MKLKICAFIIALVAVFCCFTACGKKGDGADVHVFYYTYSDTYISSVRSALDATLKKDGVSFQDYDGNGNQTTQTEQIQTAITKGAKLIVVNIVKTGSDDAANGIVSLAKNAGIPVIFFNREVCFEDIHSPILKSNSSLCARNDFGEIRSQVAQLSTYGRNTSSFSIHLSKSASFSIKNA